MTISNMIGSGNYSLYNNNWYSGNRTSTQNSIANLWSNYNSSFNMSSALSGISEIKANASALVASYDSAKQEFYSGLDDRMSDLSASAAKVKNYDFNVGSDAITTETTVDKDGKSVTTTKYSDSLKSALQTIKDFVEDYNSTHSFLTTNSDVSSRVSRMAEMFGDTTYRAGIYESIGINVSSNGTLSIDEDKLAKSIVDDPSRVSSVLGKDNLAGKAESHLSMLNSMHDNLFPSAKTLIGNDLASASLYTSGAYAKLMSVSAVGNLFNMMF